MRLLFFTNSYPYGLGELWKRNELIILASLFKEINVIPFSYGGNKANPKILSIENIKFHNPLFESEEIKIKYLDIFKLFLNKYYFIMLKEFLQLLRYPSKNNFIRLFSSAKRAQLMLDNKNLYSTLNSDKSNTILYFYWGQGASEFLPFIDVSKFNKVVVRLHGYDLYENLCGNYIPFRKQLLDLNISVLPVSETGANYLKRKYPNSLAYINTHRLGVMNSNLISNGSLDGILRIVSCSRLVSLKRIDLMIATAEKLEIPFIWKHIGGGELKDQLELLITQKKISSKFFLIGDIPPESVINFHADNQFDLFVNTSISEGVPVSIMEALSLSIPIVATDCGGTNEIVDDKVGWLLEADFNISKLKELIEKYYHLSDIEKKQLRINAYKRFEEKCDMEKVTKNFINFLLE
jgi:glycosyltransferase involved in cell wall biosynthesis